MKNLNKVHLILIGLLFISQTGCGAVVKKTPMQKVENMAYCWKPDGKVAFYRRIDHWIKMEPDPVPGGGGVYEDYEKDDEAFIVVRNPETKEEKVLYKVPYGHSAPHVYWMDWSDKNGEILLTVFGKAIYAIKANGEGLRKVVPRGDGLTFGFKQATWTTEGNRIMCIASEPKSGSVCVMDADGKNPRVIAPDADAFSISPDGKQIVYQTIPRRATEEDFKKLGVYYLYTTQDIYIINSDGTGKRLLVEGGATPAWSPDGKWILYHCYSGWFVISFDGEENKKPKTPISQPSTWSLDGKKLLGVNGGYITDFIIVEEIQQGK